MTKLFLSWSCILSTLSITACLNGEPFDEWSPRYPAARDTSRVLFVNGRFLVHHNDSLLESSDGTSWTSHPPPPSEKIASVAYGHGLYVGMGQPAALLTSTDGVNWAADSSGIGFYSVVFDGDRFVACADAIATSQDGTNWQAVKTVGDVPSFWNLLWANGVYVSSGMDAQYQLVVGTSRDAVNWTRASTPGIRQHPFQTCMAAGNGRIVVMGGDLRTLVVYTCDDGTTWVRQPDRASPFVPRGYLGAYGNGWFVMPGFYAVPTGAVMTSPDGITWTPHLVRQGAWIESVAYGNGTFVVTGRGAPIFQSAPVKPPYEVVINSGSRAANPKDPGFLTISRRGDPAVGIGLPVNISVGGSAVSGVHYEPITNRIVIPAGQTSLSIPVYVRSSPDSAWTNNLVLSLVPGEAYSLGENSSITLPIENPGSVPRFRIGGMTRESDGSVGLIIDSKSGALLRVEISTNLPTWSLLTTVTNVAGSVRFVDHADSGFRFYRAVLSAPEANANREPGR